MRPSATRLLDRGNSGFSGKSKDIDGDILTLEAHSPSGQTVAIASPAFNYDGNSIIIDIEDILGDLAMSRTTAAENQSTFTVRDQAGKTDAAAVRISLLQENAAPAISCSYDGSNDLDTLMFRVQLNEDSTVFRHPNSSISAPLEFSVDTANLNRLKLPAKFSPSGNTVRSRLRLSPTTGIPSRFC